MGNKTSKKPSIVIVKSDDREAIYVNDKLFCEKEKIGLLDTSSAITSVVSWDEVRLSADDLRRLEGFPEKLQDIDPDDFRPDRRADD